MFDAKRRFKNKKINDLFYDWPSRVTQLVNAGTLEVNEKFCDYLSKWDPEYKRGTFKCVKFDLVICNTTKWTPSK